MLCVGCSNAYLLARLIVVRVTKEPIPRFHIILVFLFLSLVISTFSLSPIFPWNKGSTPPSDSTLNYVILGVLLAYVFSQWLFFFSAAVRQLSKFLRMPVFTVKGIYLVYYILLAFISYSIIFYSLLFFSSLCIKCVL